MRNLKSKCSENLLCENWSLHFEGNFLIHLVLGLLQEQWVDFRPVGRCMPIQLIYLFHYWLMLFWSLLFALWLISKIFWQFTTWSQAEDSLSAASESPHWYKRWLLSFTLLVLGGMLEGKVSLILAFSLLYSSWCFSFEIIFMCNIIDKIYHTIFAISNKGYYTDSDYSTSETPCLICRYEQFVSALEEATLDVIAKLKSLALKVSILLCLISVVYASLLVSHVHP